MNPSKAALRLPQSRRSEMIGPGTLPPFVPDMPNGSSRQKPTFSGRPAAITEEPKLGRFRLVSFWKLRIVKWTRKPPKF